MARVADVSGAAYRINANRAYYCGFRPARLRSPRGVRRAPARARAPLRLPRPLRERHRVPQEPLRHLAGPRRRLPPWPPHPQERSPRSPRGRPPCRLLSRRRPLLRPPPRRRRRLRAPQATQPAVPAPWAALVRRLPASTVSGHPFVTNGRYETPLGSSGHSPIHHKAAMGVRHTVPGEGQRGGCDGRVHFIFRSLVCILGHSRRTYAVWWSSETLFRAAPGSIASPVVEGRPWNRSRIQTFPLCPSPRSIGPWTENTTLRHPQGRPPACWPSRSRCWLP